FFFSSRRRHTRSKRDWSSDVCSSDLDGMELTETQEETEAIANMEESAGEVEDESIPSMIVSMIPSNIFEDLSQSRDTSVISVVIFSIITGIAFMGVKRK